MTARGAAGLAIGFSSGTLPQAGAAELAMAVRAAGGTGVDLRIGKGHSWQREGVRAGLAAIQAAGIQVFFTGVGWRLGDPSGWPACSADAEQPPAEYPVKVFCAADPDPRLVTAQLAAARAAGLVPWVETHDGGPAVPDLIRVAERTGVGVVVDLRGLAEIGGAEPRLLADLAPFVQAAQVKGVLRTPGGTRHRPLVPDDLAILLDLIPLAPIRAVTVESRAGTPDADLAVLANALDSLSVTTRRTPLPCQEMPR